MRILVTGGAGYAGTSLIPRLLARGYGVTVLDPLYRGGPEPLLPFFRDPGFRLICRDMTGPGVIGEALEGIGGVIHLAAVSGYPACSRDPEGTETLNVRATRELCRLSGPLPLVFASTGSVYGAVPGGLCTEETPPAPLSLYGDTKARGEEAVRQAGGVVLRFATAFGLSPVMRRDLLPNHLTLEALQTGKLEIYQPEARRTLIHVADMARALVFALENHRTMSGETFNAGSEDLNLSKGELALALKERIPGLEVRLDARGSDPDARDYAVSYGKIRKAGFVPEVSLGEGLEELIRAFGSLPRF